MCSRIRTPFPSPDHVSKQLLDECGEPIIRAAKSQPVSLAGMMCFQAVIVAKCLNCNTYI